MKFEIYQSEKNKEYYFRLKAGNGQNILGSEGYKAKASCLNGVESVKKNATDKSRFEIKEAANGKWKFNLKSSNGQVVGSSQLYASESGMKNGIESVMKNAPEATIDDQTV
ncbi:MAG: YegP family protein [Flavobacteriales bacterium]|nr:YegP family protein [Flavobacteriales bacterium]